LATGLPRPRVAASILSTSFGFIFNLEPVPVTHRLSPTPRNFDLRASSLSRLLRPPFSEFLVLETMPGFLCYFLLAQIFAPCTVLY